MRRGARAADAIRLFALHSRKGAGDTQGNSSCRRTSGGAAGEARRRPLKPACARLCALVCAYVRSRRRRRAPSPAGARSSPVTAVRGVRPAQAPCRCAARRMPTRRRRPDASITRHSPLATRHSPLAKRQAPSAKRQAPSAKRQAPSAKRQAPSAKRQAPIGHRSSSSVPSGGRAPLPRRRARAGCRRRNDPAGHCAMGAPQRASRRSPACGYYQIW
ncbi:putative 60S ribosomal protein L19 [Burkholderia pseudomallei]|nr:putative 60S ribosomal protein L19 [Burkholderia pseudomallei]